MSTFACIDAHTCGNPVRVVVDGKPALVGASMFDRRQYFLANYDWIRKGLMFEPRGHDMMSGSIIYDPIDPANDFSILFIETSGCLPMCGHGLIGTVTVAIEHNLITPKLEGHLKIETPAGLVAAEYRMGGDKVSSVKITNVPSFLAKKDLTIESKDLGTIQFDVAYGGNFYAIIDEQENYHGLHAYSASQLISFSRSIRQQINAKYTVEHPQNSEINTVSHLLWGGQVLNEGSTARNAVFYGDKAIDRSPCGTGTSARMAQWHAKGLLGIGDSFIHESIIGSIFTGIISDTTQVDIFPAIIPSIEGWAKVTGLNTIFLEDDCPFKEGFQII